MQAVSILQSALVSSKNRWGRYSYPYQNGNKYFQIGTPTIDYAKLDALKQTSNSPSYMVQVVKDYIDSKYTVADLNGYGQTCKNEFNTGYYVQLGTDKQNQNLTLDSASEGDIFETLGFN